MSYLLWNIRHGLWACNVKYSYYYHIMLSTVLLQYISCNQLFVYILLYWTAYSHNLFTLTETHQT